MKRISLHLAAVLLFVGALVPGALAAPQPQGEITPQPPPEIIGVDDAVIAESEATISKALPDLQAYQTALLALKSGYVQTLWSHSTLPADGELLAPDKLNTSPTDQTEKLLDMANAVPDFKTGLPFAFKTDVYDGPEGQGYVLFTRMKLSGAIWEAATNVGPESWRGHDWLVVVLAPTDVITK